MIKNICITLLLLSVVLISTSYAASFNAPDNFVPSREIFLDNDHFSSRGMLFNEAFRFFILGKQFNASADKDIPPKKDKKDGFTDKKNLIGIVEDVIKPENLLNFHDVTSQMNTEERILSAVATGYLFDKDYLLYKQLDANMKKSQFWQNNGAKLSAVGDAGVDLVLFGLLSLKGDEKSRQVAQMGAEGLLDLNVQLTKRVIGMSRPSDIVANLGPSFTFDAFPSGHAYSVFTTATILGEAYKIKWLTYPIAYLTALSRIQQNTHWPSDLIVGGLLGHLNARRLMYKHNFIQESKIKQSELFKNTNMDINGEYNVYYDSNSGSTNNNPIFDRIGRLNLMWNLTQKINDKMLLQTSFHYRGQVPQILTYNAVKDISYIPRFSYKLNNNAFVYADYEDNRILYNNLGRTPHFEEIVQAPGNLIYIDNFHTKKASMGFVNKLGRDFYIKGVYSDISRNYKEFLNLNSRGKQADFEAGAFYPDKNILLSANFNTGRDNSSDYLYSYKHKGLRFNLSQKFTKYETFKLSYINENNWYKNWNAGPSAGTAYWKSYGIEYKRDFYKDWSVNVGVFRKSLLSNVNNWNYSKFMYALDFNKEF